MRTSSQLLLTFLLNAVWQVALITALAGLGSWLLRNSVARYRHLLSVAALCLAFLVPAVTSSRAFFETDIQPEVTFDRESIAPLEAETVPSLPETSSTALPSTFHLNETLGLALLSIYFGFVLYRILKLIQAWQTTRTIRRLAVDPELDHGVAEVIRRCELEFGNRSRVIKVFRSETLPVPVTIGLFHPAIILPDSLLREGNIDLLTSAIGHEFIHVARHE
jgi:beta-lactamase regulating signal transducer with metallopeptidase domain